MQANRTFRRRLSPRSKLTLAALLSVAWLATLAAAIIVAALGWR